MKKVLIIGMCLALSGCWTTQEGQKHGVFVKVAKHGMFLGTWEAELIRGGFNDGSGANGNSFKATLGRFKSNLVGLAIDSMNDQKSITINYHCEWIVMPWRGESNCFIDKIEAKK